MNKVNFTLCISILVLMFHQNSYGKKIDFNSIAKKSQNATNTYWSHLKGEQRERILDAINVRFNSLDNKKNKRINNSFNFNFFSNGVKQLILPTAYVSFCLFNSFKTYQSLTEENGNMTNFITALVKSSATWYGLQYFLPQAKKGYKKIKKCAFLKYHVNKEYVKTASILVKVNAANDALEQSRSKREEYLETAKTVLAQNRIKII